MKKRKVLFVCIHNSARSQMAEAFLKKFGDDFFESESAGLEPGMLNPSVVAVMKETGIDLSGKQTRGVFDLHRSGAAFDFVITVCDKQAAEQCPVFPGGGTRLAWSFPDPSALTGPAEAVLAGTRTIRDQIELAIKDFIAANERHQ